MEPPGQAEDKLAVHVRGRGKPVQQDDGGRLRITGFAVEDLLAADRRGTGVDHRQGGGPRREGSTRCNLAGNHADQEGKLRMGGTGERREGMLAPGLEGGVEAANQ